MTGVKNKQLTLVACYGDKPTSLDELILQCQSTAAEHLNAFYAYQIDQVHATVAGMERLDVAGTILNKNAHVLYDKRIDMNFEQLETSVQSHLPFTVRFGGYNPGDRQFDGSGVVPFRRSVYLNRSTKKLVLIGWPHQDGDFRTPSLLNIRNDLEANCGIVHKYRNDNDFFMVLGTFDNDGPTSPEAIATCEQSLQNQVENTRLDVELSGPEILIACYKDTTLEPHSTITFRTDTNTASDEFVRSLYGASIEG